MAVTKFSSGSSFKNLVKYNDFLAGNDAKQDYWMASLTDTANAAASQTANLRGVAVDSDGNVYSAGTWTSGGWAIGTITKHNSGGTLLWQRALKTVNNFGVFPTGIALDSSNNVYIAGSFNNSSNTYNIAFLTKYNTSGTIQWQRSISSASTATSISSIATDSSANVYVTGTFRNASNGTNAFIAKYNTSGTIQWQRSLADSNSAASQSDLPYGITTDSSGNVYVTGYQRGATTFITKYNTSGTIQWQRFLSVTSYTSFGGYGIDTDSSGNVYITGNYYDASVASYSIFTAKYNTGGTLQWERILRNNEASAPQAYGLACSVDSSGNVYVTGNFLNASNMSNAFIAKYNTSGTIQFQRRLRDNNATASQNDYGNSITVSPNGIIYCVGYFRNSSNGTNAFITKLPTDGTKTGTYTIASGQVLVYATLSLTTANGSQVDSAGNFTEAAASLTDAAGTNVDSANTLTAAVVTI